MNDDWVYNNEEESEMGQLHAIHLNLNAVAAVRAKITSGPSYLNCEECGEEIPKGRRIAVPGCTMCTSCKEESE